MQATNYTRYTISSKDIMIIRQHFCNDEIIKYLWDAWGTDNYKAVEKEIDNFLNQMILLVIKQPPDDLIKKITACCYDYPKCSHTQPIKKETYANKQTKKETNKEEQPF